MKKRKPKKLAGISSKLDRNRSNQHFKEIHKRIEARTGKRIKRKTGI